jgi:hypothetical protein
MAKRKLFPIIQLKEFARQLRNDTKTEIFFFVELSEADVWI